MVTMRTVSGQAIFTLQVPTKTGIESWEYYYHPGQNDGMTANAYWFQLNKILEKKDISQKIAFLRHECNRGYLEEFTPKMKTDKYKKENGFLTSDELEAGLRDINKKLNPKD